ncbi:hypothetical protein [Virgibacillus kimchii]
MLSHRKVFFIFIVITFSFIIVSACGSNNGDAEETPISDGVSAEETANSGDEDIEGTTDNGNEDENETNNEDYAYATWNGEELHFENTSCGYQPGVGYRVTALGDGHHLQASYKVSDDSDDMLDPEFDFSEVFGLELFISAGPDTTIGEGEGYVNDGPLNDVTGDELSAKGTATLIPDRTSRAEEVNPEGGEVKFEIQCAE